MNQPNPSRRVHPSRAIMWPVSLGLLLILLIGAQRSAVSDEFRVASPVASPAVVPAAAPQADPLLTLYDRAAPAIVEVLVNDQLNGSGWIADAQGHMFTAAHVVIGDRRRIEILTHDQSRLEASIVAVDLGRDLALLKLPDREEPYPFLVNAKAMPPAGASIYLIGSPMYRHGVMINGMVARNGTTFEYLPTQRTHIETIHVAASSPRGTSGGPWLTPGGQVVGLQSGMISEKNAAAGIAFAIPVEPIQFLLDTKASPVALSIGAAFEELWEQSPEVLRSFPPRTQGVVIRVPEPEGPAAKAGLREGDVIIKAGGQTVTHRDQMIRMIRGLQPADQIHLLVLRPNQTGTLAISVEIGRTVVRTGN